MGITSFKMSEEEAYESTKRFVARPEKRTDKVLRGIGNTISVFWYIFLGIIVIVVLVKLIGTIL